MAFSCLGPFSVGFSRRVVRDLRITKTKAAQSSEVRLRCYGNTSAQSYELTQTIDLMVGPPRLELETSTASRRRYKSDISFSYCYLQSKIDIAKAQIRHKLRGIRSQFPVVALPRYVKPMLAT
jgi:hypothetical protein